MNECCKDSVKHASSWQFDEGEVECDWCGTYVPVSTVSSELFASLWPPPSCLNQTCDSRLDHDPVLMAQLGARTLLNGGKVLFAPNVTDLSWIPKGKTLPVPIGLGPEPPRHPSPAREAFRNWLVDEVFHGSATEVSGSALLISDMISYALEKREQERVWLGNELLVDINNLLDLVLDQQPERWDRVTMNAVHVPGPYVGVGWKNLPGEGESEILAVAITGKPDDDESERLAQFFEAMPELLKKLQEFLARPL